MKSEAPGRFPRFFYLASCHGVTPVRTADEATVEGADTPVVTASASQLHREGVAQVVGYYGPVLEELSTRAEEAFYSEVADGRLTRDAVRAALHQKCQLFQKSEDCSKSISSRSETLLIKGTVHHGANGSQRGQLTLAGTGSIR